MTRSLLVALVLLGASLTGCLSKPDAEAAVDNTTQGGLNDIPPDGRGKLIAFEETNKTEDGVGGMHHDHDFWQGQTRIDLFSAAAQMDPYDATDGADYEAVAEFAPPDAAAGEEPKMIYEGTATVEFSITDPQRHACTGRARLGGHFICSDTLDNIRPPAPEAPPADDPSGGPSGLKLRYKHASTTNWIDVGTLEWGTPLIITVTHPTHTDMPHSTTSGWAFQVASPNKEDSTLMFTAKATVVRGEGEIPRWPGHPDFYADTCCRVILDTTAQACDTAGCSLATGAADLTPDKLVSYGTRTLHVWVNISSVTADPVLAPDVWFLWHWNTTGRDNITDVFDKEGHGFAVREHYWVLPVDDNGMDSPYADGSKWRFALGGAFFKEGLSCYGGCANWAADYTIKIIATNEELPLEAYDMQCLRDDYCPAPEDPEGERREAVREG